MPFGLTIGTERATAFQASIQDELTKRGYSPDDPVMAEYITIMVINNKSAAQITGELEDLIGSDYDHSFTDWLFLEAAKGAAPADVPVAAEAPTSESTPASQPQPIPVATSTDRRQPLTARTGVYQQAISQALPNAQSSAQKRTASARSPSPSHPNKSRRTDLPTGPRAMLRDGTSISATHPNPRSLLDRVGGPNRSGGNFQHDDIQARIDNIVNNSPDQNMMMAGGFPGMGGMDMNMAAAAGMANPLMLQEIMMNQMALMAQMASSMGIINPAANQFNGPGFPMQGMQGDMNMFPNNGFPQAPPQGSAPGNLPTQNGGGRGRGGSRGGRGSGRGRGGSTSSPSHVPKTAELSNGIDGTPSQTPTQLNAAAPPFVTNNNPSILAPTPLSASTTSAAPQKSTFVAPERPQSPTLCKFGPKCSNAFCRYSHPSPVATAESGVVLSNEACEKGKNCTDKDCTKGHVSPAVLNPKAVEQSQPQPPPTPSHQHVPTPCRFGAACTRPNCTFSHPPRQTQFAQQCKFGSSCTRAGCSYQHPEGRVLPSTFHRGLAPGGPIVSVSTPETGSMGASHNRSVKFNNTNLGAGVKDKLEKQMREIEEKKREAEKAVEEAQAAVGKKKDEGNQVAIAA